MIRLRTLLPVSVCALCAPFLVAQDERKPLFESLGELNLEDLADIKVTSATKQPERLINSASAIEVVTASDIQTYSPFNLPEALELASGLLVARSDVRTWSISARGFNSSTANKMQVMADGRLLYTPLYSGIFWDAQNTPLADIDRIEVIRGPGATLWGSNAVNGVINIITKSAEETQGWLLQAGGGNFHRAFATARYGGKLSPSTYFRVYSKYEDDDELPTLSGLGGQDARQFAQAGFRLDSYLSSDDQLTIQGDLYDGEHGIASSADGTLSGRNLLANWQHIVNANSDFSLRAYYDHTERDIPNLFAEVRDTINIDFQHVWEWSDQHKILWGANYMTSDSDIADSARLAWVPSSRTTHSYSAFVQYHDYFQATNIGYIVGLRGEYNTLGDYEAHPNLRVFWRQSEDATLWASVARASRKPTQIDTDVRFLDPGGNVFASGSPSFKSENVIAFEMGYRSQLQENLILDLAVFRNQYDDLRSLEPPPGRPFPLTIDNKLEADSSGVEAALSYQPTDNWSLRASAVLLDVDFAADADSRDPFGGRTEGNDPDYWVDLRSSFKLSETWQVATTLRHVAELPDPSVPSHTDLDLTIIWRANEKLEFTLAGRNLLDPVHPEFGSQDPDNTEIPREFFAKLNWRY